jgi:hypothetical protein
LISPFESEGLGSFDELESAPVLEQAYLLLSQFLFMSERGLFVALAVVSA